MSGREVGRAAAAWPGGPTKRAARTGRAARGVFLATSLTLVAAAARAQATGAAPVPAPPSESLAPTDDSVRTAEALATLDAARQRASQWWWFWTIGFGASAAAGGALAFVVDDRAQRDGLVASAVGATVGFASMVILPFPAADGVDDLRALPEGTPDERRQKREAVEARLEHAAQREAFGESVWSHLGGLAVSTSLALVLWLARDLPDIALRNFVLSASIGQIKIHSQPDSLPEAWDAHRTRWTSTEGAAWPLFGWSTRF